MYFVYKDSFYGTELIGKSEDIQEARKIVEKEESKWEPGMLWSVRVSEKEEKDFSSFD